MTQEEKDLLLKDLCARLPYGVKIWNPWNSVNTLVGVDLVDDECEGPFCLKNEDGLFNYYAGDIKPYLRPMSSMTEEEAREIAVLHGNNSEDILSIKVTGEYIDIILDDGVCSTVTSTIWYDEIISSVKCFDYLNKKMFDYRGLIPKGRAIEVTEENNPYNDIKD